MKRIIIDIATIYPGKGGAGGGIWSYSANLLLEIDNILQHNKSEIEFVCLVNREFSLPLKKIKVEVVSLNLQNFIARFFYIHFYLPFYCRTRRAALHKTYFEVPYFKLVRTLVTIHDCMQDFYKQKIYTSNRFSDRLKNFYFDTITRRAIQKSDLICSPSQFIKDEIVHTYGVLSNKITVTPLAASSSVTSNPGKQLLASESINIYCIAAFHRHKGHLRLLDIFETLINTYPLDVRLYLRGHIHNAESYRLVTDRIANSSLKDRVFIVNYQAKSDMQDIYQDTDWVILLSEYEGFGLPVIEAQSIGKPVICSDIPVFREVAGDSAAYIGTNIDKQSAAKKLYDLLKDEEVKADLVQKGKLNAARYSWRKFGWQMMEVYERVSSPESITRQ
jgi:glycosyltransferase involved in cell wall biosynthesis